MSGLVDARRKVDYVGQPEPARCGFPEEIKWFAIWHLLGHAAAFVAEIMALPRGERIHAKAARLGQRIKHEASGADNSPEAMQTAGNLAEQAGWRMFRSWARTPAPGPERAQ